MRIRRREKPFLAMKKDMELSCPLEIAAQITKGKIVLEFANVNFNLS